MKFVRAVFGGLWRGIQRAREWSSGESLFDAQAHRGDDHDVKPDPGIGL